ncbi:hypothetical protein AMECASPLE_039768 [Ameca splendens]|uniref:Uncharacterized protein n=1 Tax=Ameca splendens TaxID=208324 RepID=A0ABV1AEY3_9TELE
MNYVIGLQMRPAKDAAPISIVLNMAVLVFPVGAYLLSLEQAAPSDVRTYELPRSHRLFCSTISGTIVAKVKARQKESVTCKAAFVTHSSSRFAKLYSLICVCVKEKKIGKKTVTRC